MLVRIANREDPDQTAPSEAVRSGSALFVLAFFGKQLVFKILEHLSYFLFAKLPPSQFLFSINPLYTGNPYTDTKHNKAFHQRYKA